MVESGPGGRRSSASAPIFGWRTGRARCLSFDMGGTTAKAGLSRGRPSITKNYEAGHASPASARAAVFPCDARWSTSSKSGRAAARSPGSTRAACCASAPAARAPSPDRSATDAAAAEPTVTDAERGARRLNPDYFLGGEIDARRRGGPAARSRSTCAEPLGLGVAEAASGILESRTLRWSAHSSWSGSSRGFDPRAFILLRLRWGGSRARKRARA